MLYHFLLGGLALGCLIGFGAATGIEIMKTGFRRPEEVEDYLGLPVIASIPPFLSVANGIGVLQSRALLAGPGMPTKASVSNSSPYLGYRDKRVNGKSSKEGYFKSTTVLPPKFNLVAKWGPASLMAEQYRVAATRLRQSARRRETASPAQSYRVVPNLPLIPRQYHFR